MTLGCLCKRAPLPSGGGGSTATTSIAGAGQRALVERDQQIVFDDHAAARAVDDEGVLLHQAQFREIDHAARLAVERHVQRHDVGCAQQRLEVDELRVERVGARRGDVRIVRLHVHAEGARARRDVAADAAETDDAERLAGEFGADQLEPVPTPFAQRLHGLRDVAREREHQAEGVFGRGDRVGGRRVEHDDAGCGRRGDVDRVDADARARDDGQLRTGRQQVAVDARFRAHDQSVGGLERGLEIVPRAADHRVDRDAGLTENCETLLGERFRDHDAFRQATIHRRA